MIIVNIIIIIIQVESLLKCCALTPNDNNRVLVAEKLSHCHGNDEEALSELIKTNFLDRIYANEVNDEQMDNHLNEQLTKILKDETQDKEVRISVHVI